MIETNSNMDLSREILSEITIFNKYAKHLPKLNRRETWDEIVDRNMQMHIKKFPDLKLEIVEAYKDVRNKKLLPSMRSMQFAGLASEINPARLYNCAFMAANDYRVFNETMFLLLSGCGVGFSVQKHHVEELPEVQKPNFRRSRRYVIGDSIVGWADAIKVLMKSYFGLNRSNIDFIYSDIRPKGTLLVTAGGRAPGPQPLKECILKIKGLLDNKNNGDKLTTVEVYDIMCYIADAVLAGGIRRAAMIALFTIDDTDMLSVKTGNWWETNPQRGRSNNSAVVMRSRVSKLDFYALWEYIRNSGTGEPGIIWTNNPEIGVNPCFGGEEELLTPQGYKTFEELCGLPEIEIVNKDGNITKSKVWNSGRKDTVIFKDSIYTETICTPDHIWMNINKEKIQAKDLKGHRLMPFVNKNEDFDELYVKLGFIQGDGGLGRLKSKFHKGIEVNIGDKDDDVLNYFNFNRKENQRSFYTKEFTEICHDLKFDSSSLVTRKLPDTFQHWSYIQKISFIKGLFSANGSVTKGVRVSLKATSKELILQLQSLFNSLNVSSYYTTNKSKNQKFSNGVYRMKESYDLNIGRFEDIKWFYENIGFIHDYKMNDLYDLVLLKSPKIISVKQGENIDVYDFTEPETHWGVVNGFIAHNCGEISLKDMQLCNLTEINVSNIESQEDLNSRVTSATIIGTLQASYTDFHYLRDEWKRNCDRDALLGVSMTGIASMKVFDYDIEEAAKIAVKINSIYAEKIGINKAARITTVKPAGTTSLVLGTSSGIHSWHNDYYFRLMRINKNESLYKYLIKHHPLLVEDEFFSPKDTAVIIIPQKAPDGAVLRTESPIELLNRVNNIFNSWVKPGFRSGYNQHNVSCTVSVKADEWDEVGNWMWINRNNYSGISVLPYSDHTYKQPPFQDCSKEEFELAYVNLKEINLAEITEAEDVTDLSGELACSGGSCEVK